MNEPYDDVVTIFAPEKWPKGNAVLPKFYAKRLNGAPESV